MIKTKIEKIPLFLKRIKGWAGYKLQETGKKPLSVLDMKGVGPDDKDRVVDFETVVTSFQSGEVDSVGVSLSGEEITCVDLDCHDPALREKYEELKKRFSPDTPRNISEIGLMTRNVAGREKESVFFGGGRTQAECETFDKGKRVGYYSSIITKWDEADLRAERRAAVEAVLYGFEPQAFFTDAADTTRMDEFNEYAESLAMAAYGYCRGTEMQCIHLPGHPAREIQSGLSHRHGHCCRA